MNRTRLVRWVTALFGTSFLLPLAALAVISAPADLSITGSIYANDSTPTFTWSAPSGATWYEYALDASSYTSIGNVTSYTLSNTGDGWHTFLLRAHNNNNEVSSTTSLTFEIDTYGPQVPQVAPSTADAGKTVTLYVKPTGEAEVLTCSVYIDGYAVSMTEDGDRFEVDYVFAESGNYTVYAKCTDGDGNTASGPSHTMTVSGTGGIEKGDLIKTTCASGAATNDPCKAVYYYGNDGKRHVFPSESVFYNWYQDFDDVVEVSSSVMASIALGENVTYHPGTVLVKFDSSKTVYALTEGAVLHGYVNEYYAEQDWGSSWQGYIRNVPDAFFGNYNVGSIIDSTSDYDRNDAYDDVTSLDDNF